MKIRLLILSLLCFVAARGDVMDRLIVKTNTTLRGSLTYELSDESRLSANHDYGIALDVGLSSTVAKARIRSVSTIADLVSIDPLTSDIFSYVKVLGYSAAGDGGGGDFRRVLAASGTTNAGTFFTSTANPTYAWQRLVPDVYTPQMFGAAADGSTDDTDAMQQAIDSATAAGISVFVPDGTYRLSDIDVTCAVSLSGNARMQLHSLPVSFGRRGMINLASNSKMTGGIVDLRHTAFSWPTNYEVFPAVQMDAVTNATVAGVTIVNGWRFPLTVRGTTNCVVTGVVVEDSASGPSMDNNLSLVVDTLLIRNLYMDSPTVPQHCADFYFNRQSTFRNIEVVNPFSGPNAFNSAALSGITIGGDDSCIYSGINFTGVRSDVDYPTALLYDGGANSSISQVNIVGWCGTGANIGFEVHAAVNLSVDDVVLDARRWSSVDIGGGGSGMTVQNQGVFRFGTFAINEAMNYPGQQQRVKSESTRNTFSRIRVNGWRDGVQVGSSDNAFVDCEFVNNSQFGVRFRPLDGGYLTGTFPAPLPVKADNNTFTRCRIAGNNLYGVALGGGKNNRFVDCEIVGNGYGGSGYAGVQSLYSVANEAVVSATSTTVTTTTAFTTNQYADNWIYIHTGTGMGQQRYIRSMTTNVLTLSSAFDTVPDSSSRFAIYNGEGGAVEFRDCRIADFRQWTNVLGGSLNPFQGSFASATNDLYITTSASSDYKPGQLLRLKGVLSGSSDLVVRVRYPNPANIDELIVNPVSPTSGSFRTNGWVAGTGTISAASGSPESILSYSITGSGTDFAGEWDWQKWFIAGTNTLRATLYQSAFPSSYYVTPLPGVMSGQSFDFVVFDIETLPQQTVGVSVQYWPGLVSFTGNTTVSATTLQTVSVSTNYGFQSLVGGYPDVTSGERFQTRNSAATTITNFVGGYSGKRFTLVAGDTNTTIQFSGNNIKGNNGVNATLASGDVAEFIFNGIRWIGALASSSSSPFVLKTGDTITGDLTLSTADGTDFLTFTRPGVGASATFDFASGRLNVTTASGLLTLQDNETASTAKTARLGPLSHNTSHLPFYGLNMLAQSSDNILQLGGGSAGGAAAQRIDFVTTPTVGNSNTAAVATIGGTGTFSAAAGVFTNSLTVGGVAVATKPTTETLTASAGTLTITAGKGPNQSSRWVADGNVTLAFASLADNDGGRLRVWPATTNVTITLPNYASSPSGSTLTVSGGTGSTNYTEIVWANGVESSTNRVSIEALNYYR